MSNGDVQPIASSAQPQVPVFRLRERYAAVQYRLLSFGCLVSDFVGMRMPRARADLSVFRGGNVTCGVSACR